MRSYCALLGGLLGLAGSLRAQSTLLDPTFGTDGAVITTLGALGSAATDVAVMPDGRTVICGVRQVSNGSRMVVVRYLPSGGADIAFSGNGVATVNIGQSCDGRAVALDDAGNVTVAGVAVFPTTLNDIALARFTADGDPDNSFNGNGQAAFPQSTFQDRLSAVIVRPDGSTLAAGTLGDMNSDMLALDLLPNGMPDPGFGVAGRFLSPLHTSETVSAMAVRPDGRILLIGAVHLGGQTGDAGVYQLFPDGRIDSSFATDGVYRSGLANVIDFASCGALRPGGELVIGGGSFAVGFGGFVQPSVTQLMPNGTPDPAFGTNGTTQITFGAPYIGQMRDLVIDDLGRTLATCDLVDTGSGVHAIMALRLTANGQLDPAFGPNGRRYLACPSGTNCGVSALALTTDGRVMAAGFTGDSLITQVMVMRWLPEPSPLGMEAGAGIPSPRAYPNPCMNALTLDLGVDGQWDQAELVDLTGRTCAQWPLTTMGRVTLDVSDAAAGVYLLRTSGPRGVGTLRLVVQR